MNHPNRNQSNNLTYLFPDSIDKEEPKEQTKRGGNGGNDDGGDMDNLTKRVEQVEKDTHKIQLDLAVLTTRSEEFATKSGLAELLARSDEFATKGDLHKEISGQTKWIAATIIGVAALCMTAAKFLF